MATSRILAGLWRGSVLTLLACSAGIAKEHDSALEEARVASFRAQVGLDVELHAIEVEANLRAIAGVDGQTSFTWHLKSELEVSLVRGDKVGDWSLDHDPASPFGSYARVLTVTLDPPLARGEVLELELRYGGPLEGAFRPGWAELFLDLLWYPFDLNTGVQLFDVRLSIDPSYRIVSNAPTTGGEGRWRLSSREPRLDLCLAGSPTLEQHPFVEGELGLRVAAPESVKPAQVASTGRAAAELLGYFRHSFGVQEWTEDVLLVIRPERLGPQFARPGYLVIHADPSFEGGQLSAPSYRFLAHEIAHTWWNRGDFRTHEYWLAESFAEYSALMAVRDLVDPEEFEGEVAARIQKAPELPALLGVTRGEAAFDAVMTHKGSALLAQLERGLGAEAFVALLAEVASRRIATTAELLALLREMHGAEAGDWLEARLKE